MWLQIPFAKKWGTLNTVLNESRRFPPLFAHIFIRLPSMYLMAHLAVVPPSEEEQIPAP